MYYNLVEFITETSYPYYARVTPYQTLESAKIAYNKLITAYPDEDDIVAFTVMVIDQFGECICKTSFTKSKWGIKMKRIYNEVSVQTLISTMHPEMEIYIIDVDYNIYISSERFTNVSEHAKAVKVRDLMNYEYAKICKSRIRKTDISENGKLVLVIDTRHDVY